MANRLNEELPIYLGKFAGKAADLAEIPISNVKNFYVKTMLVEDGGNQCAVYITEFGSNMAHGDAVLEAGVQMGNRLFAVSIDAYTYFHLPNDEIAVKCPDVKLRILPNRCFGNSLYKMHLFFVLLLHSFVYLLFRHY